MIWAEAEIRVEFYDVDPMRVVWHGNYVRYLELGRRALLESLDFSYERMHAEGWNFPVVDLHVRYVQSAVLGQRLIVRATLVEWENRLVIDYEIRDALSGQRITKAASTQVAVLIATGELSFVCPADWLACVDKAMRERP